MTGRVVASFVFAACCIALPAAAQESLFLAPISIRMTPTLPAPGDMVALEATGFLGGAALESAIVWQKDGTELSESGTTVRIRAGALGSDTVVSVLVATPDGGEGSATVHIRPALADILWSSDAYVPAFFRGRSLAGTRSTLSLEAVPTIVIDGKIADARGLVYTWRRNGAMMASLSGLGHSRISTEAPALFATDTWSVDIATPDGAYRAGTTIEIPSADTHVVLYRDNPIFGTLFGTAIDDSYTTSDADVSFIAVPYYAAHGQHDPGLVYDWTIDRKPALYDESAPERITLRSEGPASATLSLSLSSSWNYLEAARGTWQIHLQQQ